MFIQLFSSDIKMFCLLQSFFFYQHTNIFAAMSFTELKTFQSKLVRDDQFRQNYEQMRKLGEQLDSRLRMALQQGSARDIARHQKAGKLLARDRVELLLDEDSPFLELCPLAGWGQDEFDAGASTVSGVGIVRYERTQISYTSVSY
jgi:hypothetical protein